MASARHPIALTALGGLLFLATTSFASAPEADIAEPEPDVVVTVEVTPTAPLPAGSLGIRVVAPAELDDAEAALYEWQGSFNILATVIAADYPDDFAGAALEEPAGSGWIGFTSSAPDAAAQTIATVSGVRIVTDMGYTKREAEAAVLAVEDAVGTALGPGAIVAAFRSGATSEITVVYSEDSATGPTPSVADLTQLAQQALPEGGPLTVKVERVPHAAGAESD